MPKVEIITRDGQPDSFLKNHLEANLLRYAAGTAIFCPGCQKCMDWRDTVSAELSRTVSGGKPEVIRTYTVCGKCWDRLEPHIRAGIAKAEAKLPGKLTCAVEIIDGRDPRFAEIE